MHMRTYFETIDVLLLFLWQWHIEFKIESEISI